MSNRKKNGPSPFEIMTSTDQPAWMAGKAAEKNAPSAEKNQGNSENPPQFEKPASSLLGQLNQPVIIRLPRGYAILAGLVVVGLIVLAFNVGENYGSDKMVNSLSSKGLSTDLRDNPGEVIIDGITSSIPRIVIKDGDDPRVVGLNYMILADYNKDLALKLQKFLAQSEVETFIKPRYSSQSKSTDRWLVYDMVGLENQAQISKRRILLEDLGKKWASKFRVRDLSTMYARLYKAPKAKK